MRKFPRFGRQFSKVCSEFPILEQGDKMMIPVDADYAHLALITWMHKKAEKTQVTQKIKLIHLYSTETPSQETFDIITNVAKKCGLTVTAQKVENPNNITELKTILFRVAIENGCDKIALADSLDYVDAAILTRMSCDGMFTGPSVVETVEMDSGKVTFVRPFCFLTDDEIDKFGTLSEFEVKPGGIRVPEEEFMAVARKAIHYMLDDSSNIRMNFFNSQFNIQRKFIGSGETEE